MASRRNRQQTQSLPEFNTSNSDTEQVEFCDWLYLHVVYRFILSSHTVRLSRNVVTYYRHLVFSSYKKAVEDEKNIVFSWHLRGIIGSRHSANCEWFFCIFANLSATLAVSDHSSNLIILFLKCIWQLCHGFLLINSINVSIFSEII